MKQMLRIICGIIALPFVIAVAIVVVSLLLFILSMIFAFAVCASIAMAIVYMCIVFPVIFIIGCCEYSCYGISSMFKQLWPMFLKMINCGGFWHEIGGALYEIGDAIKLVISFYKKCEDDEKSSNDTKTACDEQ